MRIFLAGATGVVGRRLVPLLTASRHRVTAVGRTAAKRATLARVGAEPVAVDLFDAAAVRTISLRKTESPALREPVAPAISRVTLLMTAAVEPTFCWASAVSPPAAKAQRAAAALSICKQE